MDHKTVRKLERELEQVIAEVVIIRNKNWKYPLLPSHHTMQMMAKAAVAVLSFQGRGAAPVIGAGVGAVIQAGWASPATVVQAGALGGVLGALAGPAFLLTCMGLGYVVPRKIGPPRHPFDE